MHVKCNRMPVYTEKGQGIGINKTINSLIT